MKQDDASLAKEIISLLLKQTKIATIAGQYERLAPGPDGRIHTQQQVAGTETGRLNSKGDSGWWEEFSTNLQNLVNPGKFPKLNPLFNARRCLRPDPGKVLLAADLGKAELFAYLAEARDTERIAMLHRGEDLHAKTAADIFKKQMSDVTYEERAVGGKFPNFALGYGGGWQMFQGKVNKDADLTGISVDAKTAKMVVYGWRRINPATTAWWEEVKREAGQSGQLTNAYGRLRRFIGKRGAGNDVIAFLPQSNIADHLNHAMVRLYEKHDPHDLEILLQVHDEILVQCDATEWRRVARIMQRVMSRPLTINGIVVNIPVEVSIGRESWGELEEIEL